MALDLRHCKERKAQHCRFKYQRHCEERNARRGNLLGGAPSPVLKRLPRRLTAARNDGEVRVSRMRSWNRRRRFLRMLFLLNLHIRRNLLRRFRLTRLTRCGFTAEAQCAQRRQRKRGKPLAGWLARYRPACSGNQLASIPFSQNGEKFVALRNSAPLR